MRTRKSHSLACKLRPSETWFPHEQKTLEHCAFRGIEHPFYSRNDKRQLHRSSKNLAQNHSENLAYRLKFKALIIAFLMLNAACIHTSRIFKWGAPGQNDVQKFPKHALSKSNPPYVFAKDGQLLEKHVHGYLDNYLAKSNYTAFLILKNDTIVYEKYADQYDSSSVFLGFSLAKSFVGTLVQIAIEEGAIRSINDSIVRYLPYLKNADISLQNVSIKQLLNMTSGISFNENRMGLNAPVAQLYYGNNLHKLLLNQRKAKEEKKFEYKNINTQFLSEIIEHATGRSFIDYFNQKLWQKLKPETPAFWLCDNKDSMTAKAYVGLVASARDFAKLGSLYLGMGEIQGQYLLQKQAFGLMADHTSFYENQWWKECGSDCQKNSWIVAKGIYGQILAINFSKKLVIVGLGENKKSKNNLYDLNRIVQESNVF